MPGTRVLHLGSSSSPGVVERTTLVSPSPVFGDFESELAALQLRTIRLYTVVEAVRDPTGLTNRIQIESAMGPGVKVLFVGEFVIDRPLDARTWSGSTFLLSEGSSLSPGSAWANNDGADESNVLIDAPEVESATAATTLTATAAMASTSFDLTSATDFQTGRLFKITGISGAQDYAGQSAGPEAPTEEVFQVSTYGGGLSIPLVSPSWDHHGANGSAKPVKLLTRTLRNFTMAGGTFSGGDRAIFGAFRTRFAQGVRIRDQSVKWFTGYAYSFRGSKDCLIGDITNLGAVNDVCSFFSCQNSQLVNAFCRFEVWERFNSRGGAFPRYLYRMRAQCSHVQFINCEAVHAVGGFQFWGGVNCAIVNGRYDDLDGALIGDFFIDDALATIQQRGVALDTSGQQVSDPLTQNIEFGFGSSIELMGKDAFYSDNSFDPDGPDDPLHWNTGFALVNMFDCAKVKVSHEGVGEMSGVTGDRRLPSGFLWNDSVANVDVKIKGSVYGFIGRGSIQTMTGRLSFNAQPGVGGGASNFMVLESCEGTAPCFDYAECIDSNTVLTILMFPLAPGEQLHLRPLFRRFVNLPPGTGISGTTLPTGSFADNLYLFRLPDSSSAPELAHLYALDNAAAAGIGALTGALAAAGSQSAVNILASENFSFAGVQRYVLGTYVGPDMVAPLMMAGALAGRAQVEGDANGEGVAASAFNRVVGQLRLRSTGAGVFQLGT